MWSSPIRNSLAWPNLEYSFRTETGCDVWYLLLNFLLFLTWWWSNSPLATYINIFLEKLWNDIFKNLVARCLFYLAFFLKGRIRICILIRNDVDPVRNNTFGIHNTAGFVSLCRSQCALFLEPGQMFLTEETSVPDPDPHVFGLPGSGSTSLTQRYGSGSGSFCHQAKIVIKTWIPTVLWLLLDFLSLINDVNVPSKSYKQKNFFLLVFWWRLEGQWRKEQDPLVRGMDPRIRIHTKMSWIRNTERNCFSCLGWGRKSEPGGVYWRHVPGWKGG